jgi:protein SCO1/2
MTARQILPVVLLAIVAFAVGLFLARSLLVPRVVPVPATENMTILPQPRALPALPLVDQDARPLPAGFLRDRWTLVFFGFTQCPDICPNTLTLLAQMQQELADLPQAGRPRVLLVSVDPQRDTPAILKSYVRFFDPAFAAATGTAEGVAATAAAFSVPYARVPRADGGYTMDHGAGLFFVSPAGTLAAYASPPFDARVLARDFRQLAQYHEETHR